MAWDSKLRSGTRTSTSIHPFDMWKDIDDSIQEIEPWSTPLQTLGKLLGRGKPPASHKILVRQYFPYDNLDHVIDVVLGDASENTERFALMTPLQASRPSIGGTALYHPQDKLYIVATGQTVEVVMNDVESIPLDENTKLTITSSRFFGDSNPHSTAPKGTFVVRNIEPYPILPFTESDIVILGRAIWESQPVGSVATIRDYVFDCNFVEHRESDRLRFTEDQKKWVKTNAPRPFWTMEQEELIKEFKLETESNAYFSTRQVETMRNGRLKRHMAGLFYVVKTNVAYYDPASTSDFETLISNWLYHQAIRYRVGTMKKVLLAGGTFLFNFARAFRDYRRTESGAKNTPFGINFDTYVLPGGFEFKIIRNDLFRMGTPMANWAVSIDPSLMEWRIVKDYKTKVVSDPDRIPTPERDFEIVIEWQGSIAWHLEQAHAILKTV